MTAKEAKRLLALHSGRDDEIDHPKWKNGFLGSLRPFSGTLQEENFTEVMECLETLKHELTASVIDREVLSDIVGIVVLTRAWASPDGMLGSNHLLTQEQTKRLLLWADIITECLMYLLSEDEEDAFETYHAYLEGGLS